MARSFAYLQFSIFDGLRGLTREGKILYFRLLVEETVNQAGIGALRVSLWARDTEMTVAETEKALHELDDQRFVFVDYDTEQVLIRTLIRNDGIADVPNVLWSACRAALQLRSPRLRRELAAELRKLPPKPADKVNEKTGRSYVYPDPHGTADAIDPGPPRGPGTTSTSHPASHPEPMSEIPSTSHAEPIANGCSAHPIDMGSRTPGGGGGGGGVSSPPPVSNNSSSKDTHTRASRTKPATPPEGFDEFWAAYPRRIGRKAAEKAYRSALKDGAEPAQILTAARRYADLARHSESERFIAHPTTWLNQGRYDDEPSNQLATLPAAVGHGNQRIPTTTQRVQAALAFLEPEES